METATYTAIAILTLILWFWAVLSISRTRFAMPFMNVVWLLVVFMFPVLGALVYFMLKRNFSVKKTRSFNPDFGRVNGLRRTGE